MRSYRLNHVQVYNSCFARSSTSGPLATGATGPASCPALDVGEKFKIHESIGKGLELYPPETFDRSSGTLGTRMVMMSEPAVVAARPPVSLQPEAGWHCQHWFYRFDRVGLRALSSEEKQRGREEFCATLSPSGTHSPARLQTFVIMGHKADFGVMMLDPDPLKLSGLHHRLMNGPLGVAIRPVWSFVSLTEVSEYLPNPEQYAERLAKEGLSPESAEFRERTQQYARRYEIMRNQRLHPDLPNWPAFCFYPMTKRRRPEANWFMLNFEERERLMAEHGETGMKFAGRVTQLVTAGIGLEDWEWGVTLWARNPQYLKEIVYRMRFDEASARYADFGPFYSGYQASPQEILEHCGI